MRILLLEDDANTAAYISKGLEEEGHTVDHIPDGRDAVAPAIRESYDVIILDRMLPNLDGLAIIKTIRSAGCRVPVLFLTALGGVDDRVEGLDAGGDDYLVKPFAFSELLARVNALARRPHTKGEETRLKVGDLEVDLVSRRVSRGGDTIDLQPREFAYWKFWYATRAAF